MKFLYIYFFTTVYLFGWFNVPHMGVAIVAQKNLDKSVKKEVKRLVGIFNHNHHTNYTFITLATYLDQHRKDNKLVPSSGHYMTIYYNMSKNSFSKRLKKRDVFTYLLQYIKVLKFSKSDIDRADALAVLLHLMGEIHQPLHVYSLQNSKFKNGDRGGNLYMLKGKYKNLHGLYDSAGIYEVKNIRTFNKDRLTMFLEKNHINSYIPKTKSTYIKSYINEEKKYMSFIYSVSYGSKPSGVYMKKLREITYKEIGYAGHRLAYLLNKYI